MSTGIFYAQKIKGTTNPLLFWREMLQSKISFIYMPQLKDTHAKLHFLLY